ncbi:hypothetical protein HPB50_007857 [Hyalomma asiaticum]|uniref:Uncharacterized protein n=1 Tax=Hyalomma asiaticum TaxID=266040 RepID=A0ACB7T8R6_HYAAI|nr:hypothetical protein HPB50_007857 [Hyalomma asiaticum]
MLSKPSDQHPRLPAPLLAEHNDIHSTQSNVPFQVTRAEEIIIVDDLSVQNMLLADYVASVSVRKQRGLREAAVTNTAILVDVPVQSRPLNYSKI